MPAVIWVTELRLSQEALDGSLESLRGEAGRARLAQRQKVLAGPPERIEVEPAGGVGYPLVA